SSAAARRWQGDRPGAGARGAIGARRIGRRRAGLCTAVRAGRVDQLRRRGGRARARNIRAGRRQHGALAPAGLNVPAASWVGALAPAELYVPAGSVVAALAPAPLKVPGPAVLCATTHLTRESRILPEGGGGAKY